MSYTIAQLSRLTGLSVHTLRYYEKEGLIPQVKREAGGRRLYGEDDLEWLAVVFCLKRSGMEISEIKDYMRLCRQGDKSLPQRLEMFKLRREKVEDKIKELERTLEAVNYKIQYYQDAIQSGGESPEKRKQCLLREKFFKYVNGGDIDE